MTWAYRTALSLDAVNLHLATLEEAGLLGIAEQDGLATVYLERRDDGLPFDGVWEEVADQDWNESWKAGIAPVQVGEITVLAPWLDVPVGAGTVLVIEPAQAFGTGHHETTVRCLAALQEHDLAGRSVFDVGTGTGVLALAAKALGAGRVLAVDIDPLAVTATAENAEINRLSVEVREGSADVAMDERFDIVLANLDTATLTRLAGDLADRLTAEGVLIVSGVSNERVAEACDALSAYLDVTADLGREWALLQARRASGEPATR